MCGGGLRSIICFDLFVLGMWWVGIGGDVGIVYVGCVCVCACACACGVLDVQSVCVVSVGSCVHAHSYRGWREMLNGLLIRML